MSAAPNPVARPPSPRHGVSPSSVVLPPGPWETVAEFLIERFAAVPADVWHTRLVQGDVLDEAGQALPAHTPYQAYKRVYYYRAVAAEPPMPFEAVVLWQDAHLVVVDKPHFLPVMPSGKYLQETVLVRLKNQLGIHTLSPIHRIDRDTAGLVLFAVQPESRAAYQNLFRDRAVDKTYQAIAPWNPNLQWPLLRESRIATAAHFMQQTEVPGDTNASTYIEPIEVGSSHARYRLKPITGQRHQLRVHMSALGLPLVGDGIYPTLTPEGAADYAKPLQLLAQNIAFTDPLTGENRRFESQLQLRTIDDVEHDAANPPEAHSGCKFQNI